MSLPRWKEFLRTAADAMDMTPVGEPAVWTYPTVDGKGGTGTTICQPITESFLVLDTWSDHDGAYLQVNSCKRFSPHFLYLVAEQFDLRILDMTLVGTLRLK